MFACSEQSCTKTFVRYSALVKHCDLGAHTRALERITIYDIAKLSYAQHLQEGQVRERPSIAVTSSNTINRESHVLPMGWALKQSSNKARFSERQKQFLDERFNIGERTGKKSNGEDVAQQMRRVCRPDGNRLFYVNEFLTPQQISSYFSRMAAKRKKIVEYENAAEEEAETLQTVTSQITVALNAEYEEEQCACCKDDAIVLPTMSKENLRKQKMAILKELCSNYGITGISGRKKEPYVKALYNYMHENPCSQHGLVLGQ